MLIYGQHLGCYADDCHVHIDCLAQNTVDNNHSAHDYAELRHYYANYNKYTNNSSLHWAEGCLFHNNSSSDLRGTFAGVREVLSFDQRLFRTYTILCLLLILVLVVGIHVFDEIHATVNTTCSTVQSNAVPIVSALFLLFVYDYVRDGINYLLCIDIMNQSSAQLDAAQLSFGNREYAGVSVLLSVTAAVVTFVLDESRQAAYRACVYRCLLYSGSGDPWNYFTNLILHVIGKAENFKTLPEFVGALFRSSSNVRTYGSSRIRESTRESEATFAFSHGSAASP
jgi:hypothetical protein